MDAVSGYAWPRLHGGACPLRDSQGKRETKPAEAITWQSSTPVYLTPRGGASGWPRCGVSVRTGDMLA